LYKGGAINAKNWVSEGQSKWGERHDREQDVANGKAGHCEV